MTTDMQPWEIAAPGDANLRMVTTSKPVPKPGEMWLSRNSRGDGSKIELSSC
jgi:hypothetical protein